MEGTQNFNRRKPLGNVVSDGLRGRAACGLGSFGLGKVFVTSFCEHGNEPALYIRTGHFFISSAPTSFLGRVWTPEDSGKTPFQASGNTQQRRIQEDADPKRNVKSRSVVKGSYCSHICDVLYM